MSMVLCTTTKIPRNCAGSIVGVGGVLRLWSYAWESKNTRRLILKESSDMYLRWSLYSDAVNVNFRQSDVIANPTS